MQSIIDEAYKTAIDAAIEASSHILKYWPYPLNSMFDKDAVMQIFEKNEGVGNYATIADKESEEIIIKRIKEHPLLKDHQIVAEESDTIKSESEFQWVIDPIDGTLNFRNGLPDFGIAIGLLHKLEPVMGIIAMPVYSQYIAAKKGEGARLFLFDKKELLDLRTISYTETLDKALIAFDTGYEGRAEQMKKTVCKFADKVGYIPSPASSSTANFKIALGQFGAYFHATPTKYDVAAATVIIKESGGVVTDKEGNEIDWSAPQVSYLGARTSQIHKQLLALLRS